MNNRLASFLDEKFHQGIATHQFLHDMFTMESNSEKKWGDSFHVHCVYLDQVEPEHSILCVLLFQAPGCTCHMNLRYSVVPRYPCHGSPTLWQCKKWYTAYIWKRAKRQRTQILLYITYLIIAVTVPVNTPQSRRFLCDD